MIDSDTTCVSVPLVCLRHRDLLETLGLGPANLPDSVQRVPFSEKPAKVDRYKQQSSNQNVPKCSRTNRARVMSTSHPRLLMVTRVTHDLERSSAYRAPPLRTRVDRMPTGAQFPVGSKANHGPLDETPID